MGATAVLSSLQQWVLQFTSNVVRAHACQPHASVKAVLGVRMLACVALT
jgi:hypothetical protein